MSTVRSSCGTHTTTDTNTDAVTQNMQLWVEYFRLELVYAQKLRARRQILGIDGSAGAQVGSRGERSLPCLATLPC